MKYSDIAKFLRYWSLTISTKAGSGHPSTSLSAADLISVFIKDVFRYDFKNPQNPANDRLIFSKGHASPLYYAMFLAIGALRKKDMDGYRRMDSVFEGHPTFRFPYAEAATGSLGQGLSIGVGMAIALRAQMQNEKLENNPQLTTHNLQPHQPRVFVLLGDGEMAEGSMWEAISIASHYKLGNLIGILDVNRLGQSGETMLGHDVLTYRDRISSFGWETVVIDGHDYGEISEAFRQNQKSIRPFLPDKNQNEGKPFMIIAKTYKGRGVSFLENQDGWHGKPLPQPELEKALKELGRVDLDLRVQVQKPIKRAMLNSFQHLKGIPKQVWDDNKMSFRDDKRRYKVGDEVATRKAYGEALAKWGEKYQEVVSLDGDVKNSTYAEIFKAKFPERFFEMYIAEQNMIGAAVGMARLGKIPFVSTFAAFLTRAFDQIRMGVLSDANVKFVGSHAGVSIGEDGPSQMGLEDIAMFRSVFGCSVVYPSDAVCTEKLVEEMIKKRGMVYMRTSRPMTPVIYSSSEQFPIGGSKVHRLSSKSLKSLRLLKVLKHKVIIIGAGVTLFEALKAQGELAKSGIEAVIVDCYSIKPIDEKTLRDLPKQGPTSVGSEETIPVITVEDHFFEGGLGDAVLNVFAHSSPDRKVDVYKLAVSKLPRSGRPGELLVMEGIDSKAIVEKAMEVISN